MNINFVSLKQVKIQIGQQKILSDTDLLIQKGAMVALIGANGSGKTTLIKALAGILYPRSGTISIENNSYSNAKQAQIIRKFMGFAPDTPPLYPQDSVYSYLQFIAELKQIARKDIPTAIAEICKIFNLEQYRDVYIHNLSKGVQQRVNLAQAMLHQPRFLLLDEPTNALDPEHVTALIQQLHTLRAQQSTIIIASHNYTDLIPQCDYMLKIAQGRLETIQLPIKSSEDVIVHDYADITP